MANRLYKEYIKINPDFIPVFSKNSDMVYPDKWQSFLPHESFKTILTCLVDSLEKGSEQKDKSLWTSGGYGVGKTYMSFTVKHILEDAVEKVEPYFQENNMMPLWSRIKAIRNKGNILVVHRSSSGNIDSQNKLFNAIVESVKETIRKKGYSYLGGTSMLEKVLSTLKDRNSSFHFEGAFEKYRSRFTEYSTPEELITDLETMDDFEEQLNLLDTIMKVAEEESFYWAMTTDELVEWLDDVRKGNQFQAILFIWDEFTEYFRNNQNQITGLQEIAQATSRISFYFFLITHSDSNQLIFDQAQKKIIEARFKCKSLEFGESTSFRLMGQALNEEKDLSEEWHQVREALFSGVKKETVSLIKSRDESITDEDFRKLLPMHPYAAYLLKLIAQNISSNQRTMFQFLSGDYVEGDTERTNFKWFVEKYGYEYGEWNYLTVDYLWDYFFTSDNVDIQGSFNEAISHFNQYEALYADNNEAMRVLKVTLLLFALQSQNTIVNRRGVSSLLRPTLKNIRACFAGTTLTEMKINQILEDFCQKGIFNKLDDATDTLFVMSTTLIDNERMNSMIEEARKQYPFDKIIAEKEYKIVENFMPEAKGYMELRCGKEPNIITPSNFRQVVDNLQLESNQIALFLLFVQNEKEQGRVNETISYIHRKFSTRCIIVDFSSLPFTDMQYENFIRNKGKERYFARIPNQADQARVAKKSCADIVHEWTKKLAVTTLHVYTATDKCEAISGSSNLRRKFKEINHQFYGYGLEEISENSKLFAVSGFKDTVAKMALGKETITPNYSYVNFITNRLETDGIWSNPQYMTQFPEHAVSKMKTVIENEIQKGFSHNHAVCVTDIWNALKKPPIGLMSCTGTLYLFAFLMKEYADSGYYLRDKTNLTLGLNYQNLSDLLFNIIKHNPKANQQYIVQQTPEQSAFCRITGEIFKISTEKRNSISDIKLNINTYLSAMCNYPMWALRYYIQEEYSGHDMLEAFLQLVDLFCEFINPEMFAGRDQNKIADEIYKLYADNTGIEDVFGKIAEAEHFKEGMIYYIAVQTPALLSAKMQLKLSDNELLELLKSKLSDDSSYLWKKEDTDRQIENLYTDLRLIQALNKVFTTSVKTFPDAKSELDKKLNIIKMPMAIVTEYKSNLSDILKAFLKIHESKLEDKKQLADTIIESSNRFIEFFNSQFEIFEQATRKYIDMSAAESEITLLYNQVPSGMFFSETDNFNIQLNPVLMNHRKEEKIRELYSAWEEITDTVSPEDWSNKYKIPILCVFDDITKIRRIFDILNHRNQKNQLDAKEIDSAVQVIRNNAQIFNDEELFRQKFIQYFCGEYSYVIDNARVLSGTLESALGKDVYNWYFSVQKCREAIVHLAEEQYKTRYLEKARQKIRQLSAEEAQNYLNELIDNDPQFGIKILKG